MEKFVFRRRCCCCWVFILSVMLVCSQLVDGQQQQLRYEYINRTSQMEVWNRYFQNMRDSQDDINLLAAVGSPLPPDVRPVTGPFGRFGRPAVEFTPQSYIGRWAKDLLPMPFYKDFGMKATIFLQSIRGGVLFNVLEYDHSKVVLGLNIIQIDNTQQAIEFIYKNSANENGIAQELSAIFKLPRFDRRWTVFSVTVHGQEVTLYFNGCEKVMTAALKVRRTALDLRENAPIFIGMPGWYIKKSALYGALYDLMIFKDFTETIPTCARTRAPDLAYNEKLNASASTNNTNRNDGSVVSGPTVEEYLEDDYNDETEQEDNKDVDDVATTQTTVKSSLTTTTKKQSPSTTLSTTKLTTTTKKQSPSTTLSTTKLMPTITKKTALPKTVTTTYTTISTATKQAPLTKGLYDLRDNYEKRKRQQTTTQRPLTTYNTDPNFTSVLEQYATTVPRVLSKKAEITTTKPGTNKMSEGNKTIGHAKEIIKDETKKISESIEKIGADQEVSRTTPVPTTKSTIKTTKPPTATSTTPTATTKTPATSRSTTMSQSTTTMTTPFTGKEIIDQAKEELKTEMKKINGTLVKVKVASNGTETNTSLSETVTTAQKEKPTTTTTTSLEDISDYVINKMRSEKLLASEGDIRIMVKKILNEEINIRGEKGEKGDPVKGEKGSTGLPGLRGLPGKKGEHGVAGERGLPGVEGLRGQDGERGDRGLEGPVGPTGAKGDAGKHSTMGTAEETRTLGEKEGVSGKGKQGPKGENGEMGLIGPPGDQGPRGYSGNPGANGQKGEKGGLGGSQKANVLFTPHDLVMMEDMFSVGSFAFVSSTDNLYIKSFKGWLQVATHKPKFAVSGSSLSGPSIAHDDDERWLTGTGFAISKHHPLDRNHQGDRFMKENLIIPPSNIVAKRPYLLLAALNEPHSGMMNGITGMDLKCLKQARKAGYHGHTFRAFLGDDRHGINSLVPNKYQHLPVANLKGEQMFHSVDAIYGENNYSAFNPRIPVYSFDMKDVRKDNTWSIKMIWHGSLANGHAHHKDKPCNNWKSGSSADKATAASIMSYKPALNEEAVRCHRKLIVLCLQINASK